MKLLLIGHVCNPHAGSEAVGTWNWAWHLSHRHNVRVLTHPQNRNQIEDFLSRRPNPRLNFHWVDVPRWIDPWRASGDGRGLKSHYWIWLRLAYIKARQLHSEVHFDVAHHVCWGSVRAPSPFWKLSIPFIWGPLGGAQMVPARFGRYFGRGWKNELGRNLRVLAARFSPAIRRTAKECRVALATNRETANFLGLLGAKDVRLWLDSGIPSGFVADRPFSKPAGETLRLLWVGTMFPRKALPLALEALAGARDVKVKLLIAGDGPMRHEWEDYAQRLNLESSVEFLGALPWSEMPALYASADAFLFTSLRDSFGTQVLEAMAHGLPILTLDHQGVATFVPPEAGIKIPVTTPEQTVRGIADSIDWLAQNREARQKCGEAGRAFAKTETWECRAERMSKLYEEVLASHSARTSLDASQEAKA
jgi:glycosyltransferase involved in cell wall biosynthesis